MLARPRGGTARGVSSHGLGLSALVAAAVDGVVSAILDDLRADLRSAPR